MWRVLGVGDNADPIERRRSGEAIGKPRRDRSHVPPAHTIADAADPARPHLILRVEKPEPRGSVLGDQCIRQRVHRREHGRPHALGSAHEVKAERADPVVHVRQQAEIAAFGNAPRQVTQLLADAGRIHVEDNARKGARPVRADRETRDGAAPSSHLDVSLDHFFAHFFLIVVNDRFITCSSRNVTTPLPPSEFRLPARVRGVQG
jgi:hypothetical protein